MPSADEYAWTSHARGQLFARFPEADRDKLIEESVLLTGQQEMDMGLDRSGGKSYRYHHGYGATLAIGLGRNDGDPIVVTVLDKKPLWAKPLAKNGQRFPVYVREFYEPVPPPPADYWPTPSPPLEEMAMPAKSSVEDVDEGDLEVETMGKLAKLFKRLSQPARTRVLEWAIKRFEDDPAKEA